MKKRIKITADNYLIDESANWWRKEEPHLIELAGKDPLAFGRLLDHYYDNIYNYLLHRTANAMLARDLASNTFYQALKKLFWFHWRGIPFSAWLYRLASREANGYFRKHGNFQTGPFEGTGETPSGQMPETDRELLEVQEKIARDALFIKMHRCITTLKPPYQEVIVLRYFENKRISDIAGILGRREANVRYRIHRALEKLRKTIDK